MNGQLYLKIIRLSRLLRLLLRDFISNLHRILANSPSSTHPYRAERNLSSLFLQPFIHDFHQLASIELVFYRRFPSGCTRRFHVIFFLYSIPFFNLHLQYVAYVTDATYLHNIQCSRFTCARIYNLVYPVASFLRWPLYPTLKLGIPRCDAM